LSDIHKSLKRKKLASPLLQAVALNKRRYRTVWQVAELYISALTVSWGSRQPSFSVHCIETTTKKEYFTM